MPDPQTRKIKCPYCGWIRNLPVAHLEDTVPVVRGLSDALRKVGEAVRDKLRAPDLDEANAWIDLPPCPHCEKEYRYNVRTQATE